VVESNRYHYDYEHYEDSYTDDYDGDEDWLSFLLLLRV
jgi:hypothetical protein